MRLVAERAARIVAIAALAWAAWSLGRRVSVQTNLGRALTDWTVASVRVTLDTTPSPVERDWLAAMRRSGVSTEWRWRRRPIALAVSASPIADPAGVTRVAVAAPPGTQVALADRLGPIDTATAISGGLSMTIPGPLRSIHAGGARAAVTDSVIYRPLLVLGTVSWESKFVVRALEERGWTVDTRLYLGPGHAVVEGNATPIDTAHYAAVIALDSGARNASAAIERYVRQGGGVIIAGSAGRVLARAGEWRDAKPLSYFRLIGPDSLIARRGNIVQVGYDDTWRLRMDSARGPAVHRNWWAALVAAVAYAPRVTLNAPAEADPAPVAATVDRLGPPTIARAVNGGVSPWIWFAVIVAALLAEWTSRRLRGAT
jgi:hypothetical protein